MTPRAVDRPGVPGGVGGGCHAARMDILLPLLTLVIGLLLGAIAVLVVVPTRR